LSLTISPKQNIKEEESEPPLSLNIPPKQNIKEEESTPSLQGEEVEGSTKVSEEESPNNILAEIANKEASSSPLKASTEEKKDSSTPTTKPSPSSPVKSVERHDHHKRTAEDAGFEEIPPTSPAHVLKKSEMNEIVSPLPTTRRNPTFNDEEDIKIAPPPLTRTESLKSDVSQSLDEEEKIYAEIQELEKQILKLKEETADEKVIKDMIRKKKLAELKYGNVSSKTTLAMKELEREQSSHSLAVLEQSPSISALNDSEVSKSAPPLFTRSASLESNVSQALEEEESIFDSIKELEKEVEKLKLEGAQDKVLKDAIRRKKLAELKYGNATSKTNLAMKELERETSTESGLKRTISQSSDVTSPPPSFIGTQSLETQVSLALADEDKLLNSINELENEIERLKIEGADETTIKEAIQKNKLANLKFGNASSKTNLVVKELEREKSQSSISSSNSKKPIEEEEKFLSSVKPATLERSMSDTSVSSHRPSQQLLERSNSQVSEAEEEAISASDKVQVAIKEVDRLKAEGADEKIIKAAIQKKKLAEMKYGNAVFKFQTEFQKSDSQRSLIETIESTPSEKSSLSKIVLHIMPLDSSIDAEALAEAIKAIKYTGIEKWDAEHKSIPLGLNHKLIFTVTIKRGVLDSDSLCEEISRNFPGDIQSIDIASEAPII
jgi:translation elongation factor EF-1beta